RKSTLFILKLFTIVTLTTVDTPSLRRVPTPRRDGLNIMLAVTVLLGAFLAYIACTSGAYPFDNTGIAGLFFGGLVSVVLWPVGVVVLVIANFFLDWFTRGRFRSRWFLWLASFAAILLLILSYVESRPLRHFRSHVMDPAPSSLADLQLDTLSSYSDGGAW